MYEPAVSLAWRYVRYPSPDLWSSSTYGCKAAGFITFLSALEASIFWEISTLALGAHRSVIVIDCRLDKGCFFACPPRYPFGSAKESPACRLRFFMNCEWESPLVCPSSWSLQCTSLYLFYHLLPLLKDCVKSELLKTKNRRFIVIKVQFASHKIFKLYNITYDMLSFL